MNKAKQNLNWTRGMRIILGIIVIIIAGLIAVSKLLPNHETSLSDLRWGQTPNLLALSNIERMDHAGLLFIRLQDGQEQFLAGNWQVNFSNSGAYAFGEFPEGYSNQTGLPAQAGQQMYFISKDRIHEIKLAGFSGQITAVHEDPTAMYVFIEITSKNSVLYCIAKRILDGSPSCQQLNINKRARARWNPEQERELVINTEEDKLYTYDREEAKMRFIDPDNEPKQHQQLASLFTDSTRPQQFMLGSQKRRFWRFLNIVLVKKTPGWSLHRVPLKTKKVAWLAGGEHLLIIERHRLSVLELLTRKLALVIEEYNIGQKPIVIQHGRYDLTL